MSGKAYPVAFRCMEVDVTDADGVVTRQAAMVPIARYRNIFARQYHVGEEYPLAPLEARSRASHSHFFAALKDGFDNLPENIAARFPNPEHLRQWLLIETNWCEEDEFTFDNDAEARAAMTKLRKRQPYARISRHGPKVIVRYALSQSAAAMDAETFQKSKQDCLDLLEHMTNVPKGALMKEAGKHG